MKKILTICCLLIVFLPFCISNSHAEINSDNLRPFPISRSYFNYNKNIVSGNGNFALSSDTEEYYSAFFALNLSNTTKRPIGFKSVTFLAVKEDGSIHRLELIKHINSGVTDSLILNPKDEIVFYFRSPIKGLDITEVKELYLRFRGGKKIYFVTEDKVEGKLTYTQRFWRWIDNSSWKWVKNLLYWIKNI